MNDIVIYNAPVNRYFQGHCMKTKRITVFMFNKNILCYYFLYLFFYNQNQSYCLINNQMQLICPI